MIVMIVAFDDARVIGNKNKLPWHLPEDLKHFRNVTSGHAILMGRTTFFSLGKPLPNRRNIVVTSHPETMPVHVNLEVEMDLHAVLGEWSTKIEPLFVIGGRSVYEQALPYATRLIVSHIPGVHVGEVTFPRFEADFDVVSKKDMGQFKVVEYQRRA